jgi:hypothetical protein
LAIITKSLPAVDNSGKISVEYASSQHEVDSGTNDGEFPAPFANVVKNATRRKKSNQKRKAKVSIIWLWPTMIALALIVAGLGTGYYVIKSAADSQAQSYVDDMKVYIDDVYDATVATADSPADIVESIDAIAVPHLGDAFLGKVFSSKYADSKVLQDKSATNVKLLNGELTAYGQVYDFYTAYEAAGEKFDLAAASVSLLSSKSKVRQVLLDIQDIFEDMENLASNSDLPTELSGYQSELIVALQSVVGAWQDVVVAQNVNDSTGYNAAFDRYQTAAEAAEDAFGPIAAYNNGLSIRVRAIADDFKEATK